MASARTAQEGDDVDAIKAASEKLTQSLQELSTRLYAQEAESEAERQPEADEGPTAGSEGPTVDAEFNDPAKG